MVTVPFFPHIRKHTRPIGHPQRIAANPPCQPWRVVAIGEVVLTSLRIVRLTRFDQQPLQFTMTVESSGDPTHDAVVANPVFEVDGHEIEFPVRLWSNLYLVLDGNGVAIIFDKNWNEVKRVKPKQPVPMLSKGNQQISFRCESAEASVPGIKVRIRMAGTPEAVR